MIVPSCKTCSYWEPFNAVCTNRYSTRRAEVTERDQSCEHWDRHVHDRCGGTMEARIHNGVVEHYCYGCLFTVIVGGQPIPETREWLM